MSSIPEKSWKADDDEQDRFGEELGDDAKIWRIYKEIADKDDEYRVSNWNRGLDNLALFAGLLSAVTSAFLLELRNDTQVDYSQMTFKAINAYVANRSYDFYNEDDFTVPGAARAVNILWVLSLILSLTSALIALMGKDWIGMYVTMPPCNLRERADIRTFRLRCVEQWHMSAVISSAPVLLHISLLLFGAGFVVFMAPDRPTQIFASVVSGTILLQYLAIIFGAVFFSRCPFQSPATQALCRLFRSDSKPDNSDPNGNANAGAPLPSHNTNAVFAPPVHSPNVGVAPPAHDADAGVAPAQAPPDIAAQNAVSPPFWTRVIPCKGRFPHARDEEYGHQHNVPEPAPIVVPVQAPRDGAPPHDEGARVRTLQPSKPHAAAAGGNDAQVNDDAGIARPLRHWNDVPLVNPDRILQSLVWLQAASPYPSVGRAIVTALGDQTIVGRREDEVVANGNSVPALGCKVAQRLFDGNLPSKERLLRSGFRATLPTKIDWGRTDLPGLLRYVRLRKNWPESGMKELDPQKLNYLFGEWLLEDRMLPEQYIYMVCLAANRGLSIDLSKVEKHCQHIDLALTTASFLMTLIQDPKIAPQPPYDELLVMSKCFGWHRRPVDASMFLSVLRTHLPKDSNPPLDEGETGINLVTHIILRHVRAAFSDSLHILFDLLGRQPGSDKHSCLFALFDPENQKISDPAWMICRGRPDLALRILNTLPLEEPDVPVAEEGYLERVTRTVVVLALDWLVPSHSRRAALQSHREFIISLINGANTSLAPLDIIRLLFQRSALHHPLTPVDGDWGLLATISSYLRKRLEELEAMQLVASTASKTAKEAADAATTAKETADATTTATAEAAAAAQVRAECEELIKLLNETGTNAETKAGDACPLVLFLRRLAESITVFSPEIQSFLLALDELRKAGNRHATLRDYVATYPDLYELLVHRPISPIEVEPSGFRLRFRSGGLSAVYKTIFRGVTVAVKSYRFSFDEYLNSIMVAMLEAEKSILIKMRHANIIRLIVTVWSPIHDDCMVFPWAENGDVRRYMRSSPQADRLQLISDIASGLAYMHSQEPQIIHLNLNPYSILVDSTGRAMIGGFSLSMELTNENTAKWWESRASPNVPLDLMPYQAPELLERHGRISSAADVFGWAMTAVEVLSGVRPLSKRGQQYGETLLRRVVLGERPDQKDHPDPTNGAPELPEPHWQLLGRCWAHDPDKRPLMAEVVVELTAIKAARAQAASQVPGPTASGSVTE